MYKNNFEMYIKASRLSVVFLLLAMVLVGSCKTNDTASVYNAAQPAAGNGQLALNLQGHNGDIKRYTREVRGLIEKSPEYIGKMLGQDIALAMRDPDLERRDFPAIVWQYRSQACVLDVYFMATEEQTKRAEPYLMPVQHFEFRKRGGDVVSLEDKRDMANCIRQIMGSEFATMRSDRHAEFIYTHAG